MTRILLFVFSILLSGNVFSQKMIPDTIQLKMTVKSQADSMGIYFIQRDFKKFIQCFHPLVLKLWGGEEKLLPLLEKGINKMDSSKESYVKVEIGEPSTILLNGTELQCTLPQTIEIRKVNGKEVLKKTLICISFDNGLNWSFVYGDDGLKDMQRTLPNLSNELVIPNREKPIFIPD